jgi:hypothetical protein
VRLGGLDRLKNPMTSSGIEPVTLRLVAQLQLKNLQGAASVALMWWVNNDIHYAYLYVSTYEEILPGSSPITFAHPWPKTNEDV